MRELNGLEEDTRKQSGFTLALSEIGCDFREQPVSSEVASTPLSAEETALVLQRLQPLSVEEDDRREFAFPSRSLKPPQTGKDIDTALVDADAGAAVVEAEPASLRILTYAPEGEIEIAPQLTVVFSHPMVALGSKASQDAVDVPVELSPQPPGRWRWLDTRTVMFEPQGRFPMATEYRVRIPAGVQSTDGRALEEDLTWRFSTPPLALTRHHPVGKSQPPDPLMFVRFNQRIDAAALLPHLSLEARRPRKTIGVRQATEAEIEADAKVKELVESSKPQTWLALRSEDPLPLGENIVLSISAGAPSAEGPRTSETPLERKFETHGDFRVSSAKVGWRGEPSPGDPFSITLSNPIDEKTADESAIVIEPALPTREVDFFGNRISITGPTKAETTYEVTLPESLRDEFGQSLSGKRTVALKVGRARSSLTAAGSDHVVVDPFGEPVYSVHSVNFEQLKVRIYKVTPADWSQFSGCRSRIVRGEDTGFPGEVVVSTKIKIDGRANEPIETRIDLTPALENGLGHAIVVVYPTDKREKDERRPQICTWVQVTQLGITAGRDAEEACVWVNSLKDGQPCRATVTISDSTAEAVTDETGLAMLPLPEGRRSDHRILIARCGDDAAFLPRTMYSDSNWCSTPFPDDLLWYVFNDRGIYRPGETVRFKGWIRRRTGGKTSDVRFLQKPTMLRYEVYDPHYGGQSQGKLLEGRAKIDPKRGFDISFELPEGTNTGMAQLSLRVAGWGDDLRSRSHDEMFLIEEYRRPEYEVKVDVDPGPHFVGGDATATVSAKYYAGGGLSGADVKWTARAKPAAFRPPGHDDFSFGRFRPFWTSEYDDEYDVPRRRSFEAKGSTNAVGEHRIKLDFQTVDPPLPTSVVLEASVADINRQEWTDSRVLLVHSGETYPGLRCGRTFLREDAPIEVDVIACDINGKTQPDSQVQIELIRLSGKWKNRQWIEQETGLAKQTIASTPGPAVVRFDPPGGGEYRLRATVSDAQGRPNRSELTIWIVGGTTTPSKELDADRLQLTPSKREYEVGDTAEVLVRSPFFPAEGTCTVRRAGIVGVERFQMSEATYTLSVPITEEDYPAIQIEVDVVGVKPRLDAFGNPDPSLPPQPAFAAAEVELNVPPRRRALDVKVEVQDDLLQPGGETELEIEVRTSGDQIAAEGPLAVVVIDEALAALTDYDLSDPLEIMYAREKYYTRRGHSREFVVKQDMADGTQCDDPMLCEISAASGELVLCSRSAGVAFGGRGAFDGGERLFYAIGGARADEAKPIEIRQDFNPVALFLPNATLDANGCVRVPVKLPDSVTRYRVIVAACWGANHFGRGESAITARLPLMVRPSPPRFLNYGDGCELAVVVQNCGDAAVEAAVAMDVANLEPTAGMGRAVTVPAGDRVEVRFPVKTASPGTARVQLAAVAPVGQDSARLEFPVWTPATIEDTAVYGEIDDGAVRQAVDVPEDVDPRYGGLEVTTSSTALASLTDALLYLVKYPYECAEQLASRILAVSTLGDVLDQFNVPDLPKPRRLKMAVRQDLEILCRMQNGDGGFPFWRKGDKSWPFLSVYVPHVLSLAAQRGFEVPEQVFKDSKVYLRKMKTKPAPWYCRESRWALEAYALHVRTRIGDADGDAARELLERVTLDRLPLEAAAWLLSSFWHTNKGKDTVDRIVRHFDNRASQTAATAHFATSYADGDHVLLHSDRRADAIIMESLIDVRPDHPLIPKLARGLQAHRTKGRWANTQENAFVLMALRRYFDAYESQTPDFVARCWLGSRFAAEQGFAGRTTERSHVRVPMDLLKENEADTNVTLAKEGPGRLYYRIGMSYVPSSLRLKAENSGFTVGREYEAIDSPDDVEQLPDGTWRIKAGARVRVCLDMVAPSRRYHVALVDPLPAGLEAVNPALAVSPGLDDLLERPTGNHWWNRPWFDHQNLRDDRAEVFRSLLWEGSYKYEYIARATAPGRFVTPPPKAEEMYHPETFGRGKTDIVVIE